MPSTKPDISLLIGAVGGTSPSGSSGALIRKQLQEQLKNGITISKVTLGANVTKSIQSQLNNISKNLTLNVKTVKLPSATVTSPSGSASNISAQDKNLKDYQKTLKETQAQEARFSEYIRRNNALRAEDQQRWYRNIGLDSNSQLNQLNAYYRELERRSDAAVESARSRATSINASFSRYLQSVDPKGLTEYASEIERIQELLRSVSNTGNNDDLRRVNNEIRTLKANMRDMGYEGGNAFTYLQEKFRTFSTYLISSAFAMVFADSLRRAVDVVYDLDDALTNLRIVMDNSEEDARALVKSYNEMAQELGRTTTSVTNAAIEWQRQGYDLAETNTLIRDSMVLSIVGDVDETEAATALTSAMKGYQLSVEEAIGVVDRFTSVDQVAATSAGDLAIALSRTAANAHLAGLSLDEVIGQLAVVNETMQEAPESTGTFYNTMLARMRMIRSGRLEDPESGESLSDVETTLSGLGIKLRDSESEFRNFGDVLDEVGQKWDSFSGVQQSAIATAFAGTRQQNRFITLMSNWETALEYTSVAADSAGTALDKFGVYEDSLEAKTNRLAAAFENLAASTFPTELMTFFIDGGTALLNLGATLGGFPATVVTTTVVVTALAGAINALQHSSMGEGIGKFVSNITNIPSRLSDIGASVTALPDIFKSLGTGAELADGSVQQLKTALGALTPVQIANIAASQQLNDETLKAALSMAGLSEAEQQRVVSAYANVAATNAQTAATNAQSAANVTATATTTGFKNAMVGLGTVIKAHPLIFTLSTVLTLVPLISSAFDALTKTTEEMKSEFSETESEISFLTNELKSLGEQIDELRGKGDLSFTDEEELSNLEKQNKYLQDRLYLLKETAKAQADEVNQSIVSDYNVENNGRHTVRYVDNRGDTATRRTTLERQFTINIAAYRDLLEQGSNYALMSENEQDKYDERLAELKEYIRETSEYFSEQADALESVDGSYGDFEEYYIKFSKYASMGADALRGVFDSSNISNEFDEIWSQDAFENIRKSLTDIASQGELTANTLNAPEYQTFIKALEDVGVIGGETGASLEALASHINSLTSEVSDATEEVVDLSGVIETLGEQDTDILNNAISALSSGAFDSFLTADDGKNLDDLISKFPDLRDEILAYANGVMDATELQKAFDQVIIDFNADAIYDGILDVVSATETYGASSNQVLQAVQNLGAYIPGFVDLLYDQETGQLRVSASALTSAESLYQFAQEAADAYRESRMMDMSNATSQLGEVAGAAAVSAAMVRDLGRAMREATNDRLSSTNLTKNWLGGQDLQGYLDDAGPINTQSGVDTSPNIDADAIIAEVNSIMDAVERAASRSKRAAESASDSSKDVEEYTAEIDQLRDSLKRLSDIQDDIATKEAKLELIDEDDVDVQKVAINELIGLYRTEQDELHSINNERDQLIQEIVDDLNSNGFQATYDPGTNDFWVQNLEHINELKAYTDGVFDQEATNELRKQYEDLIASAQEYADANIDGSLEWLNIQREILDLNGQIADINKEIADQRLEDLKSEQESINDLINLEKDRITQAGEDMIDALEDEVDAYEKIISHQKELLSLKERERSYNDEVSSSVDEIAKLQAQADALALDDSRAAQAQRGEILEEIAEKQKELADLQHENSVENTEDALDKELEMFEDNYNDRIDEIRDFLNDQERLTELAYKNIEQDGQQTYEKLQAYCKKYADISGQELKEMWDAAIDAVKEYGSLVQALDSISSEIGVMEDGDSASQSAIISQMRANGQKWHSASPAEQERLVAINEVLAGYLGLSKDKNFRNGRWYWPDGTPVYHTGGVIGNKVTAKQNELMLIAEKGEMIFNAKQQDNLGNILSGALRFKDIGSYITPLIQKLLPAQRVGGPITIDASVTVQGGMVDDAVLGVIQQNQRKVANIINKVLLPI